MLYLAGVDVHDSGVCAGKDCIYVVGGRQRGEGACKFDLETHQWMDLPDMGTGRRCPGKYLIRIRMNKGTSISLWKARWPHG